MFKLLSENLYGIQNIIAALIAGLIAWRYNSTASILNKEQFTRQLIKDFEDRYIVLRRKLIEIEDAEREQFMKEQLGEALSPDELLEEAIFDPLSDTHPFIHTFEEYLSLSSSQHYWWKRKYIDDELWSKWAYSMSQWYQSSNAFQAYLKSKAGKAYDEDFLRVLRIIK